MNKTTAIIAMVLVTVTALFVMVNEDSEGATQQIGTDFYYIVTDANSRTYSTAPSDKVYIDCDYVRADAFKNCTNVKSIYCSEKVKRVDARAFQGCTNLSFISLPGATSIGEYAFYNSGISRVWVQPCLTSIGAHAFENCSSFKDMLTWQTSVKTFGDSVFKNSGLREIDLRGITSIASNAFEGCTKLKWQFVSPGQDGIKGVDRIVCGEDVKFKNIFDADYGMQLEVERYLRFVITDGDGNEQRNEYWENIPNYFNRIYMENGQDYYIDTMSYTIHFPGGLGIEDLHVDYGRSCALPVIDTGDFTHSGWTVDGLDGTFITLNASHFTKLGSDIYATPVISGSSTVLFDHSNLPEATDTSSLPSTMDFTYGDTYPDLGEVDSYRHIGWRIEGTDVDMTAPIGKLSAHTAESLWESVQLFDIVYRQSDGTEIHKEQSPKNVVHSILDLSADERPEQRFIGWSVDGTEDVLTEGDTIIIVSDIVLIPRFEERAQFNIAFVSGSDLILYDTCYEGRVYTITVDDPTDEWKDFICWTVGGKVHHAGDSFPVSSDMVLSAVWAAADRVELTYHTEPIITKEYRRGTSVTVDAEPGTRENQYFAGWTFTEGSDSVDHVNGNIITVSTDTDLYPVWRDILVTFTYELETPVSFTYTKGTTVAVHADPGMKEDMMFAGWTTAVGGEVEYTDGSNIVAEEDTVFHPVWSNIDVRFTFVLDTPVVQTFDKGSIVTIFQEPGTREFMAFVGWTTVEDGTTVEYVNGSDIPVIEDMTFYPVWRNIDATITFHTDIPVTVEYVRGAITTLDVDPGIAEGREFLGWTTVPGSTEPEMANGDLLQVTGDIHLYPVWVDLVTFTFEIDLPISLTYRKGAQVVLDVDPGTRSDKEFIGWTLTSGSDRLDLRDGETVIATEDKVLHPVWRYLTVTFTYHTGSDHTVVHIKGSDATVTFDHGTMEKKEFLGWARASDAIVPDYIDGKTIEAVSDMDLYPVWVDLVTFTFKGSPETVSEHRLGSQVVINVNPGSVEYKRFGGWTTVEGSDIVEHSTGDSITASGDMTFYPVWEDIEVTFSFVLDTTVTEKHVLGTMVRIDVDPGELQYKAFSGWSESPDGDVLIHNGDNVFVSGDMVLYPVWEDRYVTFTYVLDGNVTVTHVMGSDAEVSCNVPSVEKREFLGWSSSDTTIVEYENGTRITAIEDMTFHPIWVELATVSFHISPERTFEYRVGSTFNIDVDPGMDDNRTFVGWSLTEGSDSADYSIRGEFTVTGDVILYPVWADIVVTFTYHLQEDIEVPHRKGSTVSIDVHPGEIDKKEFRGWSTSPDATVVDHLQGESVKATEDLDLYPVWADLVRFTFHMDPECSYDHRVGKILTISVDPGAVQYKTFAGWSITDGSSKITYDNGTRIIAECDMDFYPVWADIPVTFTYHLETTHSVVHPMGTTVTVSCDVPSEEGREFLGWSLTEGSDSADIENGEMMDAMEDMDLYPVWVDLVSVTFEIDPVFKHVQRIGTEFTIDQEPGVDENREFMGWSFIEGSTDVDIHNGQTVVLTEDLHLYPVWRNIIVTFTYCLSEQIVDELVKGSSVTIRECIVVDENREFIGWSTGPGSEDAEYLPGQDIIVKDDMTFYPVWADLVLITYHTEMEESYWCRVGSEITVSADPGVREYLVFAGWSLTEDSQDVSYRNGDVVVITEDMHLYPVWTDDFVTFTYMLDEPVSVDVPKGPGKVGCNVTPPEGMMLLGWTFTEGSIEVDLEDGQEIVVTEDMTFYPVWEELVPVTFETNPVTSIRCRHGETLIIDVEPGTYDNHEFLGWTLSEGSGTVDYENGAEIIVEDWIHLYPVWREMTVTFTFHLEETVVRTYVKGSQATMDVEPGSITGKEFLGWSLNEGSEVVHSKGDVLTAFEDMDFYPVWKDVPIVPSDPDPPSHGGGSGSGYHPWYPSGGNGGSDKPDDKDDTDPGDGSGDDEPEVPEEPTDPVVPEDTDGPIDPEDTTGGLGGHIDRRGLVVGFSAALGVIVSVILMMQMRRS